MLSTVAVVVQTPVAVFELGVLAEVFGVDRTDDGVPAFDYRLCAEHPGTPLPAGPGTAIVASEPLSATADADLVAIVSSSTQQPPSEPVLDVIRDAHKRGAYVLALCSGVFALAHAGVLAGRAVATHWRYSDALAAVCPDARIDRDILYYDDGRIVSCAGTASGIDTCLHLVRAELGPSVANRIARRMVVPPLRGGDQQQVRPDLADRPDTIEPLLDWLDDHLDRAVTLDAMARVTHTSERTLLRRFAEQLDTTPHEWLTRQRFQRARQLLVHSSLSVEDVACQSGFDSAHLLRHHSRRLAGMSPTELRRQSH